MSLLPGPKLDQYLYFKKLLVLSNGQATYQDGAIRPVWIRDTETSDDIRDYSRMFVETENWEWVNPDRLPGFVRTELTAEASQQRAEEEKKRAEETAKPKNFAELQQQAEQKARNYLTQRKSANRQQSLDQSGLSERLQTLAEANRRFANEVAGSKGRRN